MPVVKKESKKNQSRGVVSNKVRSHANDPFFVKKVAQAKETLSKTDLSNLLDK
ncbi:MAG TPA: hypothetical protein VIJ27_01850 [Mucilaginibacter sp.]